MEEILTTEQAAPLLGVARRTVVTWCQQHKFPGAYLPGRSRKLGYRIPKDDVLALLEEVEREALQKRIPA